MLRSVLLTIGLSLLGGLVIAITIAMIRNSAKESPQNAKTKKIPCVDEFFILTDKSGFVTCRSPRAWPDITTHGGSTVVHCVCQPFLRTNETP